MMYGVDEEIKNEKHPIRMLVDREVSYILESIENESKSAQQIIVECNMAESTAYRKLRKLARENFLEIKYVVGQYGRWEMRYKSNVCLLKTENSREKSKLAVLRRNSLY